MRISKRQNKVKFSYLSVFERIPARFDNYFEGKFQRIFDKFRDSTVDVLTKLIPVGPRQKDGKISEFRLFAEYIKPGLYCFQFFLSSKNLSFYLLHFDEIYYFKLFKIVPFNFRTLFGVKMFNSKQEKFAYYNETKKPYNYIKPKGFWKFVVNDNKLIARSLKTSKKYIIDHSVDWSCLMMLKTIFDSYKHDINLSEIIGLGGDGVVVKKTVEIGGRTQEFAVKYTR